MGADAQATSTAPSAITTSQTTITLVSSAGFPVPATGQQYTVRIDTTPISTVYEYALVTGNNTGTNTLTVTRGQYGTSAQSFATGATVSYVLTWEQLTAMFPRVDYGSANPGVVGVGSIGTSAGKPTTGTWTAGQIYVDSLGVIWVCTAGGTPGVWLSQMAMTGVSGAIFGTLPASLPNGAHWLFQCGQTSPTTNGAGGFNIALPTAFPNGLITAHVTPTNVGVGLEYIVGVIGSNCNASNINGLAWNGTTPLATTTFYVSWFAIGW